MGPKAGLTGSPQIQNLSSCYVPRPWGPPLRMTALLYNPLSYVIVCLTRRVFPLTVTAASRIYAFEL